MINKNLCRADHPPLKRDKVIQCSRCPLACLSCPNYFWSCRWCKLVFPDVYQTVPRVKSARTVTQPLKFKVIVPCFFFNVWSFVMTVTFVVCWLDFTWDAAAWLAIMSGNRRNNEIVKRNVCNIILKSWVWIKNWQSFILFYTTVLCLPWCTIQNVFQITTFEKSFNLLFSKRHWHF